ncbi:MAG: hypothetical protein II233_08255 [Clostridia bacterium]|nr:hypothetical protein [Clostridia bacterium]MEE1125643.1 hypothetical protein [Acutalibacteraceae bacterium]
MKRIIALLMASLMVMSITGCKGNENNTGDENTNPTESITATEESTSDNSNTADEATTVGQTLLADFKSDSKGTAQEIADRLITNPVIQFMGGATPVEEGLLSGFDNAEIKGFKEGVMFAPMMSSIAFVGYIFELPEDADVEAFKTTLKDSANLRWNICVEAEELIVENDGNKVFFLMCPKSFEQPEAEDGAVAGDMDIPAEDMVPAEDGITLE